MNLTLEIDAGVQMHWGIRIPLRDGVHLNATLYVPTNQQQPAPVVFTLTPYIGQTYHDQAMYFAAHGLPFLTVDVRGRGNSGGVFNPYLSEAEDGHDVVEWLSRQSYCNGRVSMWGGSYAGYNQWMVAKELPPSLATIVPTAAPYFAVDFPIRNNIASPYWVQWLALVSGRTSQDRIFADQRFWNGRFKELFETGAPFNTLDALVGNPSEVFQEWVAHPRQDAYWDSYNPTAQDYARLTLPVLTITGIYDGDQLGALTHFREHLKNIPAAARQQHYLVIGPWDHAGTRVPRAEFGGLRFGAASLVDLQKLHLEWYVWHMQGGSKPQFLEKNVAYYVTGAEQWRYADTIESITARSAPLYLDSSTNPSGMFFSGALTPAPPSERQPDHYIYDPSDVSHAEFESSLDLEHWIIDQRMVQRLEGKQLYYHSAPFEADVELSGFFALLAWIAIDQADTDFNVCLYEVDTNGGAIFLTSDSLRARHREGLREEKLISTREPLRYEFRGFSFVSRLVRMGHRLRLVIGPMNSIQTQRNFNRGGVVAGESIEDARTVMARLFHDDQHPSALYVPVAQPADAGCASQEPKTLK